MSPDLEAVLDDMASDHIGLDLIRQGIALLLEGRKSPAETALVLHDLAGDEGKDVITAFGLAIEELAAPYVDRVADREVFLLNVKHAKDAAERWDGRQSAIDAIAAIERAGRRCDAMTDDERKELSDKVREVNKRTEQRPR